MTDLECNSSSSLEVDAGGNRGRNALPLSSAQTGIWFAQRLDPSSSAYNIAEYIEIDGRIDPTLFERALRQVVSESEALHVQFVEVDGEPRQIAGASSAWSIPLIDLSGEADAQAAAEAWMNADLARPIDPTRDALFGYALLKASATRYFWYARYHHLVMDGYGMWLVARRVADAYTQLCTGQSARENGFGSLVDLLDEDAAYRASEQLAQDRQFWIDYLEARPEHVSLASNRPWPAAPKGFLRNTAYLSGVEVDTLRSIARRAGTSLARVMSAATAIFLYRRTGLSDVVIGLPVAARSTVARNTPGMVSNVLPLRVAVRPSMTVDDVVDQTSLQIRQGLEHQRYQLADLRRDVGALVEDRALFGLSINFMPFNYDVSFAGNRAVARNLSLGPVEDLSISVYDRCDGAPLRIDFDANPVRYSAADLAVHQQRFLRLLTGLSGPERAIGPP